MGALVGGGSRLGTTPLPDVATTGKQGLLLANTLYERIRKKHGFESRMRLLSIRQESAPPCEVADILHQVRAIKSAEVDLSSVDPRVVH